MADIHTKTAAAMFGVPIDEVSLAQRQAAMNHNFKANYGASPERIYKTLKTKPEEAERLRWEFLARDGLIEEDG